MSSGLCSTCNKSLSEDTNCTINNKKVCYTCKANQQCARCNGYLDSSVFVNAANKVFHENCFRCSSCSQVLQSKFFVDGGNVSFTIHFLYCFVD